MCVLCLATVLVILRPKQFSLGFGIINFVFAIPAFFLMDTIGRRSLLLLTFPFLAFFQFMIAVATSRTVNPTAVTIGMYLFCAFYSIGEGPVPFVSVYDFVSS